MTLPWARRSTRCEGKIRPTVFLLFLLFGANRATSQQLDQSNLISVAGGFASETVSANNQLAQTFTVGKSGLLTQVNLQLYKLLDPSQVTHNVTVQLYLPSSSSTPLGTLLASRVLQPSDVPAFDPSAVQILSFQVATPPVVSVGEVLSFVLTSDQPDGAGGIYDWVISQSVGIDVYHAGTAWQSPNLAGFSTEPLLDFGFQTYVSPLPEPPAIALLGMGGIVIALGRAAFYRKEASKSSR